MERKVELLPPSAFQKPKQVTVPLPSFSSETRQTSSVAPVQSTSLFGAPYSLLAPPNQAADVLSATDPHKTRADNLTNQVQSLQSELQKCNSTYRAQLHVLEGQLQSRSAAYQGQIEKLEVELRGVQGQSKNDAREHVEQIQQLESQLKEKSNQVDQLKCYVAEQSTPSTQICKKQLENLQCKIQGLEKEKRDLENSVDLLTIRLQSHDQIQSIHDSELSQAGDVPPEKKKQILLKRWRTKVYELLVQMQSADLIQRKDSQIQNEQISHLKKEYERQKQEVVRLQHSLQDKQASLELQLQQNNKLEQELQSAEQVALELDNRNKGYQHTIGALVDFTNRLQEAFSETEAKNQKINETLQLFSQRITFASGRVELLQSQFARKDALLRMDAREQKMQQEDDGPASKDSALLAELQQELERLARERDSLAKQSKEDTLALETRLVDSRQSHETQVHELKDQIRDLQEKLQTQSLELASAQESRQKSQEESSAVKESMGELETRLEHMQSHIEQEVEAAYERDQEKHRQELAELQQKLSDANREHSKTVVSLRQLERQMGRERERMNEDARRSEEVHKQQLRQLEHNVKQLEKERNLLMTTLRQEGLVGKHRAARASPAHDLDTLDTFPVNDDTSMEAPRDFGGHTQSGDVTAISHDVMQQSGENTVDETQEFGVTDDSKLQTITDPGSGQLTEAIASRKDTYFEETGESQQIQAPTEDDLADVIKEVKKLSDEVMLDSHSDGLSDDSEEG